MDEQSLPGTSGASLDLRGNPRHGPRHHYFREPEQFRAKVQCYRHLPPEVTLQKIDFDRDIRAVCIAAENGLANVPRRRGRRDPSQAATRTEESLERSRNRAKTSCRKRVTELAPSALVTFTTRRVLPMEELEECWSKFVRLGRQIDLDFEYICVPEPHPSNPLHFHLHAAVRGNVNHRILRRLWHIVLEAAQGRRVTAALRGVDSPGNVDVQRIKASQQVTRVRKIARYVSKYITKDLLERFNRKAYWSSKGITVEAAKIYWLDSLDQLGALKEAMQLLGHWDESKGYLSQHVFMPATDRVAWYAVTEIPDPPF